MSAGGDGEGAQVRRVGRNFLKMSDRSVRRSRGGEVTRSIQGVIKFHAIDSLGVRGGAAKYSRGLVGVLRSLACYRCLETRCKLLHDNSRDFTRAASSLRRVRIEFLGIRKLEG